MDEINIDEKIITGVRRIISAVCREEQFTGIKR